MVCPSCGSSVEGAFCSKCGSPVPTALPPAYGVPQMVLRPPRVQSHLQLLGIFWCVYGVIRAGSGILAGLFLLGIATPGFLGGFGARPNMPFAALAPWMSGLAMVVVIIISVGAVLALLTGISLLMHKPWGRILSIVIGILALITIPFGTALGIYTLWVMAPSPSGAEYDAIAVRS